MRDSNGVPLGLVTSSADGSSPAEQIREHLELARLIAERHGYGSLLPFLEIAGHGLDEIERMNRPVPRVAIVRN